MKYKNYYCYYYYEILVTNLTSDMHTGRHCGDIITSVIMIRLNAHFASIFEHKTIRFTVKNSIDGNKQLLRNALKFHFDPIDIVSDDPRRTPSSVLSEPSMRYETQNGKIRQTNK